MIWDNLDDDETESGRGAAARRRRSSSSSRASRARRGGTTFVPLPSASSRELARSAEGPNNAAAGMAPVQGGARTADPHRRASRLQRHLGEMCPLRPPAVETTAIVVAVGHVDVEPRRLPREPTRAARTAAPTPTPTPSDVDAAVGGSGSRITIAQGASAARARAPPARFRSPLIVAIGTRSSTNSAGAGRRAGARERATLDSAREVRTSPKRRARGEGSLARSCGRGDRASAAAGCGDEVLVPHRHDRRPRAAAGGREHCARRAAAAPTRRGTARWTRRKARARARRRPRARATQRTATLPRTSTGGRGTAARAS